MAHHPARAGSPAVDWSVRTRFRDGDPEAVRTVYTVYAPLVYAVAHRVLGDRALSEEAAQETFLKAWRGARSVDPNRELGPWLMTIAKRVAIDVYRREALRSGRRRDELMPDDPALSAPPATEEDLHAAWDVRSAVLALPEEEREVVRLQHLEGFTHAQIAERMAIPLGTVKSRSFRAHRRLAEELDHLRVDVTPRRRVCAR